MAVDTLVAVGFLGEVFAVTDFLTAGFFMGAAWQRCDANCVRVAHVCVHPLVLGGGKTAIYLIAAGALSIWL